MSKKMVDYGTERSTRDRSQRWRTRTARMTTFLILILVPTTNTTTTTGANSIPDRPWTYSKVTSDQDLVLGLSDMVSRLQAQVSQLQEQRAEDRALLQLLQESSGRTSESGNVDAIRRFEGQLTSLKSDLSGLVASKEREAERSGDLRELRLEFDGVHSECQKLRMDVQSLRDRREDDLKRLGQLRNSQVTVKWLQTTVEELRKEMKELAAVQNVSAALRQQQQFETGLGLLRSDVVSLRSQLEESRVAQDRAAADLVQVQQDLMDLHNQHHQMAANAQLFREELSQFKDELVAVSTEKSNGAGRGYTEEEDGGHHKQEFSSAGVKASLKSAFKKTERQQKDLGVTSHENDVVTVDLGNFFAPKTHHRLRHHGKMREELEKVKSVLQLVYNRQSNLDDQMGALRRNHSVVDGNIRHVWGRMADLLNSTRYKDAQQAQTERAVTELQTRMKRMEQSAVDDDKVLHDLAESVTGIDKLHSSTVQLFEALETLEDEYSKQMGDLHREVSKFEFNMAQLLSTVNIMKEDQGNHYESLKGIRSDVSGLKQDIEQTNYKLAALRSEVLQDEAQRFLSHTNSTDRNTSDGQMQTSGAIADLEVRIARLNAQFLEHHLQANDMLDKLNHKADLEHVAHWASSADQLDDKIANLSQMVKPLQNRIIKLEGEVQKVYLQFPSDCSKIVGPTGVYQIFPPNSESPLTALCDMDTADGGWTVVQQRYSAEEDFHRDWAAYKAGFGTIHQSKDFWLGNDHLHRLTSLDGHGNTSLRLDMWDVDGRYYYIQYGEFRIEDESHLYQMHVGADFVGNVSDALRYHDNMNFSSRDADHDASSQHCANQYEGGWWYNHCQHANLNGKYTFGLTWYDTDNNAWLQLKRIQMKIRPASGHTVLRSTVTS